MLDAFFKNYLQNCQLEMDVALCTKIWLRQIYLPEFEEKQPELHHFYRPLDILEEMIP
ncbi:MAG: hypothetical protein AB2448_12910 [Moorella sp. (in: firmicutes)]